MEEFTVLFVVAIALFADLVGFKYKAVEFVTIGGIISMYGLAQLATDQTLTLQHDLVQLSSTYVSYTCTIGGTCSSDVLTAMAALSVFTVTQFLWALIRSLGEEKEA